MEHSLTNYFELLPIMNSQPQTQTSQTQTPQTQTPQTQTPQNVYKTKEDCIKDFGNPTSSKKNNEAFFAHSYEEDCYLMGGLGGSFHERLEFNVANGRSRRRVVYLDKKGNVMKIF